MRTASILVALLLLIPLRAAGQEAHPAGGNTASPTGEIRGTITISASREAEDDRMRTMMLGRYGFHGAEESALHATAHGSQTPKLSERAVVYLESDELDRGTYPLPAQKPILDQKNLQFHPHVLPILVGTTVEFPNRDNLFHNVFSYSGPKDFDLGRYPKDDSRSVTFDRPGIVRVYCDIHSHMHATILVLRHPFFAVPDDNGAYVIRNVPPGKYRLVLWYERELAERRTVEVRAGTSTEEHFTY